MACALGHKPEELRASNLAHPDTPAALLRFEARLGPPVPTARQGGVEPR